ASRRTPKCADAANKSCRTDTTRRCWPLHPPKKETLAELLRAQKRRQAAALQNVRTRRAEVAGPAFCVLAIEGRRAACQRHARLPQGSEELDREALRVGAHGNHGKQRVRPGANHGEIPGTFVH